MCAIFGLGFQWNTKIGGSEAARKILRSLFFENMMRGKTASGIAYVRAEEITVFKDAVPGDRFVYLEDYKDLENYRMVLADKATQIKERPYFVMGHCRLKTKGTELDNKNNHPIVRDNVVGVHNGVITNDDILFARYQNRFDRYATVDSEIIFALIDYHSQTNSISEAITMTTQELVGSYACTMVHTTQPHVLWLFRNHGPCDVLHYKEEGFVVWSSALYFIEQALTGFTFSKPDVIKFPPSSGLAIDFHRNKVFRFNIGTCGERYVYNA